MAFYQLSNCPYRVPRMYEVGVHLLFKLPNKVHVTMLECFYTHSDSTTALPQIVTNGETANLRRWVA